MAKGANVEGIQHTTGAGGPNWVPSSGAEGTHSPGGSGDYLRNLVGLPMARFLQEFIKNRLSEQLFEEVLATVAEGALAQMSTESLQNGLGNLEKLLEKLPPEVAAKVRAAINTFLMEVTSSADFAQLPGKAGLSGAIQEALKGDPLEPGQLAALNTAQDALYLVVVAAWKSDPAGLREALATGEAGARRVGPDPSQRV